MSERLYVNAKVFTGRGEDDFASAFRVVDGRFAWVGSTADVARDKGVDLHGRTVLPGFIDVHTHPTLVARTMDAVACTPPQVASIDEMIEALRGSPRVGQGGDVWIEGWGYDESKLAEHRTPTAVDLDKVSRAQPVYVMRSDCHSGICNTRALERAGITRDTPDPPGGAFGRGADGAPNGVLLEIGANDVIRQAIRPQTYDQAVHELVRTAGHYSQRGIVAVTDLKALREPDDHLAMYRDAGRHGMPQQVVVYYDWAAMMANAPDLPASALMGDVRVGGIKLFMDGSVSNRTAWVSEPYPGGTDRGMATVTDFAIQRAYEYATRNKLQIAVHAMGDSALQHVIDVFADLPPWLHGIPSVRLDHATLLTDAQLAQLRAARMSFGVVTQIIFFFAEHDSYVQNLSPAQYQRAYPLGNLYRGVEHLALSSDAPATTWADPDNVFTSIKAAVGRRAYNGADIGQEQAITVPQAVLLYTGRAQQVAPFPDAGKIAVGYDASFIILDRDAFTVPVAEIDRVQVDETYIRGERVFQRD